MGAAGRFVISPSHASKGDPPEVVYGLLSLDRTPTHSRGTGEEKPGKVKPGLSTPN